MRRILPLLIAIAGLAHGTALRAEDADAPPPDPTQPEEVEEIEEIQVPATPSEDIEEIVIIDQRSQSVAVFQESAIEMEWVTEEEIAALPATDAAQVVSNLAGIRIQQRLQGQQAAVSIEGMPAEYTRLLVDGQRWSGEIGGVGDLSDVPLRNVSRIEVLRGTQGVRFGSDAAGGVINMVTHDAPEEGWRSELEALGGADERARSGGTGSYRLGPLGVSLAGEYDRIDGFDPANDSDITRAQIGGRKSEFEKYFAYGKWDLPLGDSATLRGNGLWRVEDDDYVTIEAGSRLDKRDTNWRGNAGLDWHVLKTGTFTGDFTFYRIKTDSKVGRDFKLDEDEKKGEFSYEQYLETGPVSHFVRLGGIFEFQQLDLDESDPPENIDNPELEEGRELSEDLRRHSVYLQVESELAEWFTLVAGTRVQFHSRFNTKLLPQVGILLKPHDTLNIRSSWGLNHRTPSLRDLYQPPTAQQGGAYFLAGNPNLQPEDSMSVRGGFEWTPRSWFSLAAAGFYNDIDDHIRSVLEGEIVTGSVLVLEDPVFDEPIPSICEAQAQFFPDPADWTPECQAFFSGEQVEVELPTTANLFRKQNIDSLKTWGIESQLRVELWDYGRLAVDYSWLRTRVSDSNVQVNQLPNEPKHVVNVRAEVIIPRIETRLTGVYEWRDGVIPDNTGLGLVSGADSSRRTDSSYRLDLRAVQPLRWGVEAFFDVLNVTDENRSDSYAIRGRTWLVGIRGRFGSES